MSDNASPNVGATAALFLSGTGAPSKVSERSAGSLVDSADQCVEPDPALPPRDPPTVLSLRQKVTLVIGLAAMGACLAVAPIPTIISINAAVVIFFMASNLMKLVLIGRALNHPSMLTVDLTAGPTP